MRSRPFSGILILRGRAPCPLRKTWLYPSRGSLCKFSCLVVFDSILSWVLTVCWCRQVATHLKSLAKRARLNEGHVKAARVYKARVAALTSERVVL